MKFLPILAASAALVAVAACNSAGDSDQAPAADNVAAGTADASDVAEVMRARQSHYKEMGKAMKGISGELKSSAPDMAAIQRHAALMAGYGPQLLTWFPEGSGAEAGRTRAKAEVWSDAATFRQAAERFEQAAARFHQAAQGGDIAAVRAAQEELGASCKNCHDRFRAPEE